jgi:hypothetical protein
MKDCYRRGRESFASLQCQGGGPGGTPVSGLSEMVQLGKDVLDSPREGFKSLIERYPGYWMWNYWGSYKDELLTAQLAQGAREAIRESDKQHIIGLALNSETMRLMREHEEDEGWSGLFIPALNRFISRAASIEMQRSLLVTAIALKRFQIRHGTYPENLASLQPEFVREIPRDPVDGKPLRYRRNTEESFLLYSVGEDGVDDGGNATPPSETSSNYWTKGRDLVWPQPASRVEARGYFEKLQTNQR